jgi:digeranylgeranylglycerophospholipid reductase
MKDHYDVIVVGAGPGGLMSALTLAKEGQDVLLVDIKKEIPKVNRCCCTALITEPNTHGDTVTIQDNNIHFEKTDITVRYTGQWVKLEKSIRLSPGEKKLTMANEQGVAWPYSKEVLLKNLLEDAERAGVDVLNETAALKAENINGGVKVVVRGGTSRSLKEVRCKVAVAADGVNSQIVKGLELFNKRKYITSFHVASYFLEGAEVPYPNSWITFIGKGHTRDGKSQLYMLAKHLPDAKPGDEPIIDMMCGTPRGFSAIQALDYFVASGRFSHWFKKAKVVHTSSAALNFYSPIMDPAEGNIVVVGDAASFIETYCQGAVMYGYRAAKAILTHLETGEGFKEYTDFWRSSFEYCWPGEMEKASRSFGLHILDDKELDYIFGLTDNEVCENCYISENTAPDVVKKAILSHMDQIKKERPDIAKKFEALIGKASLEEALEFKPQKKE